MYLKSIRLEGFKSFADKTIFEFNKGITAVVGPNGSGKSNIVDAIKWVLGEQSVKSLRGGSKMIDVIFSGTEKREGLNRASVTLTFDNSDRYLNSEFNEIEVKRSVYKSGENEYFINNNRVRLKDITELFIDSGGGLDAFNIISQGSVNDIVNSKPTERRQIFESAAGVLKYKKRKEESIRKLERTKENLVRVKLIIDELSTTVLPLKEQSEIAKKYSMYMEELKNLEIALSGKEITEINKVYKTVKERITELNNEVEMFNKNILNNDIENIKLNIIKNDEKIAELNKNIIEITEKLANITSLKNISLERAKYKYSEDEINRNLINLKENELDYQKDIKILINENNILDNKIKNYQKDLLEKNNDLLLLNKKISSSNNEISINTKELFNYENKLEILENNIENNEKVPYSVKNILNNPRLNGIHDILGNLVSINEDYLVALNTSLASSTNFIIVDNEISAKEAINYLKDNKLGRATFLPLNIIKPKFIDQDIKDRLVKINGFLGVLSDLVEYSDLYDNIIKNQLGNVIIAKDIDSMNLIGKIINYRYRIVSLDGSIIHAGGSISGGIIKNNSIVNNKIELEKIKDKISYINESIIKINKVLLDNNKDYEILNNQIKSISTLINNEQDIFNNNNNRILYLKNKLVTIVDEIKGIDDLSNNKIDLKVENLLVEFNEKTTSKELMEQEILNYKNVKIDLNNKLIELEKNASNTNSLFRNTQNELMKNEVLLGKMEVKLDNLLLLLNEEYNITYEYALNNYELTMDEDLARGKVNSLKREIKALGEVNTGSIKEYERLSARYDFLVNQQNDLEISLNNLLEIINEMDQIMITKFEKSFKEIKEEFKEVFKTIFKGGNGELRLTDPEDYLNTGIELVAVPPGKKMNNTAALSGGEKSLTAICLLFAIINVSTVPFIILDEVEAALDEVNVDMFGNYLSNKKNESQFIIITHKKRMMEYADVLYGITMQELGISKVVGVKLENDLDNKQV